MAVSVLSNIRFPKLKIEFRDLPKGFSIFNVDIAFYGILIAIALVIGLLVAQWQAKRTKQNPEIYLDFVLYAMVFSLVGARLYYVIFNWKQFQENIVQILNIRNGGLAIYGAILGAVLTASIYCNVKKVSFLKLCDTAVSGLLIGQVIGRFGNFFNREAFGSYADNIFAMQIDIQDAGYDYLCSVPQLMAKYHGKETLFLNILEIREKTVFVDGITYIQVHPTFLYEAGWNFCLFLFLFFYTRYKKFDGEILLLYLFGYGVGRAWIENLRTDPLFLWGTQVPVSQFISVIMAVGALLLLAIGWKKSFDKN